MPQGTDRIYGWITAGFALAVLALCWAELTMPLARMSYGMAYQNGERQYIVARVSPQSDAAAHGIRFGDRIGAEALSFSNRLRLMVGSPPGTALTVPVYRGSSSTVITFLPRPTRPQPIITAINATIALLIFATLAFRRPSVATAGLVFYGSGAITTFAGAALLSWISNPAFGVVAALLMGAFSSLPVFGLLLFITRFPSPPQNAAARLRMHVGDAIVIAAVLFELSAPFVEPVPFSTWERAHTWLSSAGFVLTAIFAFVSFVSASGETKRRIGWVLAGLCASGLAFELIDFLLNDRSAATAAPAMDALLVAAQIAQGSLLAVALAYAVLKHRVLDVGFVINRTVVYGILTTVVVVAVSAVDWLTGRLIAENRFALAVEAIVAIGFGLALNWLHARIERLVDRVVFRDRHIAERLIEERIDALAFATSEVSIGEALSADATEILHLSSAAVFYRIDADPTFHITAQSRCFPGSAETIDGESLLVRMLLARERPYFLHESAVTAPGLPVGAERPVLAVPISAQHQLIGFVLYGAQLDGALPDPKNVALLRKLASAAGTAYGMVEARRYRTRVLELEALADPARTTLADIRRSQWK